MKTTLKLVIATALLSALLLINASCAAPQETSENQPPLITRISGATDWAPASEGEFNVTAEDPDGDSLTYTWLADNGTLTPDGDTAIWFSPEQMGKYNITVKVTDTSGHESTLTKEVRVFINADGSITPDAPVLLRMSMSSSDNVTGSKRVRIWTSTPVECVVDGKDLQDLKYIWTASNGKIQGKGLKEDVASKVMWIAPGVAGDYTLDVVVDDNHGNQCKGTVNFQVFCCGN
ncbi:MAG: hypothetical protein JXA01_05020 [Dehalococcoidia bacterium]|nr:hypothetical protein [Dehalococcoidia bacterium]